MQNPVPAIACLAALILIGTYAAVHYLTDGLKGSTVPAAPASPPRFRIEEVPGPDRLSTGYYMATDTVTGSQCLMVIGGGGRSCCTGWVPSASAASVK